MDINQLKQEARELERQGRYREALAMYRHALTSLEGSPQLLRELPLYVKAGDLYLKLDKVKAGVSLYEQVGKIYAAHGSAKSVGAVCIKVVRAMPERAHVYPRMVRIMLERGHIGPARAVLELWAEHARLATTHALLSALDEVSDEDMRSVLEAIVEVSERLEGSPATSSAAAAAVAEPPTVTPAEPEVSQDTAPPEDTAAAPAAVPPPAKEAEETPASSETPAIEVPSEPPATAGAAPEPEGEEPADATPEPEPAEAPEPEESESESVLQAQDVDEPATGEADAEVSEETDAGQDEPVWLTLDEKTEPASEPIGAGPEMGEEARGDEMSERRRRPTFGSVLVQQPKERSGPSGRSLLIGLGAAVIVIALVAVPIVWLGIGPFGVGEQVASDSEGTTAIPPVLAVPGEGMADSAADTTLPMTLDPNPAFAAEPVTAESADSPPAAGANQSPPPEAAADSAVQAPAAVEPVPVEIPAVTPAQDTTPTLPTVAPPTVAPAVAPATPSAGGEVEAAPTVVVAIQGLAIDSIGPATRNGDAGQEVTQTIESGRRVTVFSRRSDSGPAEPEVSLEQDAAVGRTSVGGFAVEIRGDIEATVMWQLMDRLAARNAPSN